jgi:membrane dipeptidase
MPGLAKPAFDPQALHSASLVIDTHADTPQRFLDLDEHGNTFDFVSSPLGHGSLNLAAARAGNLAAQFFAIWVDPNEFPAPVQPLRALELLDAVHRQVEAHPADLRLCLTPADILDARAAGRFAVLLGLEGGHAIAESLALLRTYHRLGVRYMTLTWSHTTTWADSSGDAEDATVPHHNGLSEFGKEVIAEMNRLGMMIDVSHASDKTLEDVLAYSTSPIIASHSSARALTQAPRNLTDDQIRAIASAGGVVMVNFFPAFISESWRQAWNAMKPERDQAHATAAASYRAAGQPVPFTVSEAVDRIFTERIGRPPLSDLIDHFEHILKVAGEDHIGIGSDFDGIPTTPQDMTTAADLPNITAALAERGIPAATLTKLLGTNLLKVFETIQSHAKRSPLTK